MAKPFTKNDPRINKGGRPKGAVDKKWASLQYWFDKVMEDTLLHPKLKIEARLDAEMRIIELLLERKKLPPENPEESVANAAQVHEELKRLEDNARSGAKSVSN